MYIKRKVYSVTYDETTGEERMFSTTEIISEENYLQKEFSSKEQKLLRRASDYMTGLTGDGRVRNIKGVIESIPKKPKSEGYIWDGRKKIREELEESKGVNRSINMKSKVFDPYSSSNRLEFGKTYYKPTRHTIKDKTEQKTYDHSYNSKHTAKRIMKSNKK